MKVTSYDYNFWHLQIQNLFDLGYDPDLDEAEDTDLANPTGK